MTLTRFLIIFAIIVGSTLTVLAFGNPQWHKQIYMFQWKALDKRSYAAPTPNSPHYGFTGIWRDWDENGDLEMIHDVKSDGITLIFNRETGLDRRAEFGVPVE